MLGPWLRAPRGMPACPRKHAMALAACLGLDCQPMGAAMALALAACTQACLGLGCLPMGAALALAAACPGLGWLHARGGLPWALAAACPHIWGVIS